MTQILKDSIKIVSSFFMAPRVGLEPTTTRLTAECSTIELSGNITLAVTYSPADRRPKYQRRWRA